MAGTSGDIVKGALYTAAPIVAAFGTWGVTRGRDMNMLLSAVLASGAAIGAAVVSTWVSRAAAHGGVAGLGLLDVQQSLGALPFRRRSAPQYW